MLKLSKATSPQKMLQSDCVTLWLYQEQCDGPGSGGHRRGPRLKQEHHPHVSTVSIIIPHFVRSKYRLPCYRNRRGFCSLRQIGVFRMHVLSCDVWRRDPIPSTNTGLPFTGSLTSFRQTCYRVTSSTWPCFSFTLEKVTCPLLTCTVA